MFCKYPTFSSRYNKVQISVSITVILGQNLKSCSHPLRLMNPPCIHFFIAKVENIHVRCSKWNVGLVKHYSLSPHRRRVQCIVIRNLLYLSTIFDRPNMSWIQKPNDCTYFTLDTICAVILKGHRRFRYETFMNVIKNMKCNESCRLQDIFSSENRSSCSR